MVQDDRTNKLTTLKLIRLAKTDARKSVAIWLWGSIGFLISLIPFVKIPALILGCLLVLLSIPRIDLSTPEIVRTYSQHPALYTKKYVKHVKVLRFFNILCGWICGSIFISLI